jgi:hypothetical protein
VIARVEPADAALASPLGRVSPLAKLGIAVGWFVVLAFTTRIGPPLALAAAVLVTSVVVGRVPVDRLVRSILPLLAIATSVGAFNALFAAANTDPAAAELLRLGPIRLTEPAVIAGLGLAARVVAIVAVGVAFAQTTDSTRLVDSCWPSGTRTGSRWRWIPAVSAAGPERRTGKSAGRGSTGQPSRSGCWPPSSSSGCRVSGSVFGPTPAHVPAWRVGMVRNAAARRLRIDGLASTFIVRAAFGRGCRRRICAAWRSASSWCVLVRRVPIRCMTDLLGGAILRWAGTQGDQTADSLVGIGGQRRCPLVDRADRAGQEASSIIGRHSPSPTGVHRCPEWRG